MKEKIDSYEKRLREIEDFTDVKYGQTQVFLGIIRLMMGEEESGAKKEVRENGEEGGDRAEKEV